MAAKRTAIIGIIIAVIITIIGLWGAFFYRDEGHLWIQNIYSDLFGAGIFAAILFIFIFVFELLDGD